MGSLGGAATGCRAEESSVCRGCVLPWARCVDKLQGVGRSSRPSAGRQGAWGQGGVGLWCESQCFTEALGEKGALGRGGPLCWGT